MPLFSPTSFCIHTVIALNGKETVSISVQYQLQVHLWFIVDKQPRVRKLSGPEVSCWIRGSRTRQRAQLLLLTYIYYCQLGGMVDFTLLSLTNEMISIFTSQTLSSWEFICHIRRPMTSFLSLNLYDTPGLASRINVLSWRPGDFHVRYTDWDTLWNAWIVIQDVLWSIRGSYSAI